MKQTLVGHTGFVGGNLAVKHPFDGLYNSKNIQDAFGADNGLVVYSGMPAEKFWANANPQADLAVAENALSNIRNMKPEKLVLISTVDVYPSPSKVYEDTPITGQSAGYGANRLALETWVRQEYPDALIVRLPGLFGKGLKKNFIYDMLTITPSALTEDKYRQLVPQHPLVEKSYQPDGSGFYRLQPLEAGPKQELKDFFAAHDFNALSFTDSRSVFQFYDLSTLWEDINRCLKAGLHLVNFGTQPIEAGTLYNILFGQEFENHTQKGPVHYDMRTHYGRDLGGADDYIADNASVVAAIAKFVATGL